MSDQEIKALVAEHFPGVPHYCVMLIERPGGWWASLRLGVGPWKNRWKFCELSVRAGSDGDFSGEANCLYTTPQAALLSLKRQVVEMRDRLNEVLA